MSRWFSGRLDREPAALTPTMRVIIISFD